MIKDKYFDKFPLITYSNNQAVDITKRVAVTQQSYLNPYIYYPYDIDEKERADNFTSRYYQDAYKSWLVYLSNKIIDPYYEWYLSQTEFEQFLINKYGSIVNAYDKTAFYRNNWDQTENISISYFDALPPSLLKYWEPVYGNNDKMLSFKRKEKNWILNTNKINSYTVNTNTFIKDEICNIIYDPYNSGTGQVLNVSNNVLYIQHTTGTTLSNSTVLITSNSYIYGRESKVNTSFSTSNNIVTNVSPEEEVYWTPITYYTLENEKNQFNKTIDFSHLFSGQHDARILENGNLSVYDNGTTANRNPRVLVFKIDEKNKSATIVKVITGSSQSISSCCGTARELEDGAWMVNWGGKFDAQTGGFANGVSSTVLPNGVATRILLRPANVFSYRVIPYYLSNEQINLFRNDLEYRE